MDQILWQVIIGFLVNVAAGVFTELVVFSRKKSLSEADLEQIRRIIESKTFDRERLADPVGVETIKSKLPDWISPENRDKTARELSKAIAEGVRAAHESDGR